MSNTLNPLEGEYRMTIYFVRRGHPDYKNDCLTELGKKQAQRAAAHLRDFGIEEIYASTKGRAMEPRSL